MGIGLGIGRGSPMRSVDADWLLRDEFVRDLAAGSVNGTPAVPGPGTRTVVDTGNRLSLSGGVIVVAAGMSGMDPAIYYPAVVRAPGKLLIGRNNPVQFALGYSDATTAGSITIQIRSDNLSLLYFEDSAGVVQVTNSAETPTSMVLAMRSAGMFLFLRLGSKWILAWIRSLGATNPFYPCYGARFASAVPAADFIRVPDVLWLPTPLASDGFGSAFGTTDGLGHAEGIAGGIGAGGSGKMWSNVGGTWSNVGGKAINTPTAGGDLVTDGDMEAVGVANWTTVGTPTTVDKSGTQKHGGSQALRIVSNASGQGATQTIASASVGTFYKVSAWLYGTGAQGLDLVSNMMTGAPAEIGFSRSTSWVQISGAALCISANPTVGVHSRDGGSYTSYADDIKFEALALSEVLSVSNLSSPDVFLSVSLVSNARCLQGIALSWDSSTNPQNGVLFIPYSTTWNTNDIPNRLYIYKYIAGVMSLVGTNYVLTYSANARLVVAKNGSEYRIYYNNAFIVAVTISDASIVNNTLHGLFSTDASNTLDDFVCYATGTGGEYAELDKWS